VIERPIVGEATTPDGIRVVIFADVWRDHQSMADGGRRLGTANGAGRDRARLRTRDVSCRMDAK